MRLLLLPALALLAAPALAQTDDAPRTGERTVTIERHGDGPMIRRMIVIDGDTTITEGPAGRFERDGADVFELEGDGPNVFRLRGPDGVNVFEFDGDGPNGFRLRGPDGENVFRLRMEGGPEMAFGDHTAPLRGMMARMMGGPGAVSPETRERMRSLEREARELARDARQGDADAEARLDDVLGELFEVRGEARRERAAALRAEAAEIEAALAEREARREALIEARRAELLGTGADW